MWNGIVVILLCRYQWVRHLGQPVCLPLFQHAWHLPLHLPHGLQGGRRPAPLWRSDHAVFFNSWFQKLIAVIYSQLSFWLHGSWWQRAGRCMLLVRWGNDEEKKKMCMHSVKFSPEKTEAPTAPAPCPSTRWWRSWCQPGWVTDVRRPRNQADSGMQRIWAVKQHSQ